MKNCIFLLTFLITLSLAAADWGPTGHRATAVIAEQYLSPKAKRKIKKLLGKETFATVSTYADEIKGNPELYKYSPWHYVNIAPGDTYITSSKNPKGDLVTGIEMCKEILTSKTSTQEEKVFYLKLLIHFMGDLHQPLHMGHQDDKGGNDFQVQWFGEGTNLHSVWDAKIIESYGMSYSELVTNFGQKDKQKYKIFTSGNLLNWVEEGKDLVQTVYNSATKGENLKYNYLNTYMPIVEEQIEKGGMRLAAVLNAIYN